MHGFELGVQDGELHQPVGRIVMDVPFPGGHRGREIVRADGHEPGVLQGASGRSDPVGNAPVLARGLAFAADAVQQHPVRFADDALRQGQFLQQLPRPAQGSAVVEHFADVAPARRRFRFAAGFELQHLAHGGLRALDARGKDRFLRRQRRKQDVGVGGGSERAGVARHGRGGRPQERDQRRPFEPLGRKPPGVVVNRGRHRSPSPPNPSDFRFSSIAASSRAASACCARHSAARRRILASNGSPSSGGGSAPT